MLAHKEWRLALPRCRLDLYVVHHPSVSPGIGGEVAIVDQDARQHASVIVIRDIGCLPAIPCRHGGVLWMASDIMANSASPICSGEARELRI